MRDVVTTLLDAVALLLFAAGAGVALSRWAGDGAGLAVAGVVLGAGSWLVGRPPPVKGEDQRL